MQDVATFVMDMTCKGRGKKTKSMKLCQNKKLPKWKIKLL